MTGPDELLPDGVPAFGDPAYDELRGALGELAETGPMPAEVAARLDDVLAGLARSRTGEADADEQAAGPVVPLRRRSRVGQRLLVAAAAVIVVGAGGVGLTQVLGGTQDETADSSSSAADAGSSSPTAPEAATADTDTFDGSLDDLATLSGGRVLALTRADFSSQTSTALAAAADAPLARVLKNLELRGSRASTAPDAAPSPQSGDALTPTEGTITSRRSLSYAVGKALCAPVVAGAMTAPIVLDGTPAVLVVFGVADGVRHVEARACDGSTVLAAADLPQ